MVLIEIFWLSRHVSKATMYVIRERYIIILFVKSMETILETPKLFHPETILF